MERKERKIESGTIRSVMMYLFVDAMAKYCTYENELYILTLTILITSVILTLKIFGDYIQLYIKKHQYK